MPFKTPFSGLFKRMGTPLHAETAAGAFSFLYGDDAQCKKNG